LVKIKVLVVGKTKEAWIKQGILHYLRLLRKYSRTEVIEIKEEKVTDSKDVKAVLDAEGERIIELLNRESGWGSSGLPVALDKGGREVSSEGLADFLKHEMNRGSSQFTFILGGALGLSPRVLDSCRLKLSLSRMTFTHEMSRIILLEQIYRALSILGGSDYHK
jgi:23S rRNA (pseudouridine1915-N3)-methyltransferase